MVSVCLLYTSIVARDGKTQANLDYLKIFAPVQAAEVNKADLQTAIESGAGLIEGAYDADKWEAFKEAYKVAVEVMNNACLLYTSGMLVYKDSDYEYLNDVVETDIKSVSKEEKTEEKKEAAPALLKEKEMLAMPADGMIKPLSEEMCIRDRC